MDTPGMRTVIPLALLASLFGAQAHADGAVGFFSHDIHVGNFEVKCLDCHDLPPVGTPVIVVSPGGERSRRTAEYYRRFVLPWIGRRLTGRSSGDGRRAKIAELTVVDPASAQPL